MRFWDNIPKPLPSLPPEAAHSLPIPPLLATEPDHPIEHPVSPAAPATPTLTSHIRQILQTPRNIFGLFRRYHSETWPSHDPEEHVMLRDNLVTSDLPDHSCNEQPFHPYPNEASFRLGDWYWNHGAQKLHESFRELLDIIGDPNFSPDKVRDTPWSQIDADLGTNNLDGNCGLAKGCAQWMDEDAGWNKSHVRISAPFHNRTENPGVQEYVIGDLYHCSLVPWFVKN
jgi:hypothetical protein